MKLVKAKEILGRLRDKNSDSLRKTILDIKPVYPKTGIYISSERHVISGYYLYKFYLWSTDTQEFNFNDDSIPIRFD